MFLCNTHLPRFNDLKPSLLYSTDRRHRILLQVPSSEHLYMIFTLA